MQYIELIFYQSKIANAGRHIESDVLIINQINTLSSFLSFRIIQNICHRQTIANILSVAPPARVKEHPPR